MFRLPGNIPVTIHPFFLLLAFGIGWLSSQDLTKALIWGVVILLSILWHEMGHAYTTLVFGQKPTIDLMGLGGVTRRYGGRMALWKEFLITLNGPLFGFLLAIIADQLLNLWTAAPSLWRYALMVAFFVNFYWTILNLLPVVPLDGGRLMTIIFEAVFGLRGIKIALFLSIIFGVLISAVAFYAGQLYIGAFFVLFVFESYREWNASLSMTSHDRDIGSQLSLKEAQDAVNSGNIDEGIAKLQEIREKVKKGQLYIAATVQMGELLAEQNKIQESYDVLSSIKSRLPADSLALLQSLAYQKQDWQAAVQDGTKAYQAKPHYEIALLNALAYAQMNEVKPAVGWIHRAFNDGLPNHKTVLMMQEFDSIRNNELFQKLI